jgi:hypothetical protein
MLFVCLLKNETRDDAEIRRQRQLLLSRAHCAKCEKLPPINPKTKGNRRKAKKLTHSLDDSKKCTDGQTIKDGAKSEAVYRVV